MPRYDGLQFKRDGTHCRTQPEQAFAAAGSLGGCRNSEARCALLKHALLKDSLKNPKEVALIGWMCLGHEKAPELFLLNRARPWIVTFRMQSDATG